MRKSLIAIGAVVLLIVVLCFGGCSSYNGLVKSSQAVDKQWGNVENAYQRRADLIPNLVNTVKGYAEHESTTLQKVTDARVGLSEAYNKANATKAGDSQENIAAYQKAQSDLSGALDIYVNAVREAYPDLKANTNFENLQVQLEGTENRVATERKRYNDMVEAYNVKVLSFPNNMFASMFGFHKRDMFHAEEGAQRAPKVEF